MIKMSIRSVFEVTTQGVGRKDYSSDTQTSVEPVVRSHQARLMQGITTDYVLPVVPFPNFLAGQLYFPDLKGVANEYAPSDHQIMLYSISISGSDPLALTITGLQKYHWPDYTLIENVAIAYGIGGVEISFTKGHVVVPGVAYLVPLSQWHVAPTFSVNLTIHGMEDTTLKTI